MLIVWTVQADKQPRLVAYNDLNHQGFDWWRYHNFYIITSSMGQIIAYISNDPSTVAIPVGPVTLETHYIKLSFSKWLINFCLW